MALDNFFYTKEHDWIRFSGVTAFIGVAQFKLTGIPKIDDIGLFDYKDGDIIEQGTMLLNLHYRDYIIPVYAPVTFTLLETNPIVAKGLWEHIAEDPEGAGWLFKVAPGQQDKSHLQHPSFYTKLFPTNSAFQS